MRYKNLEQEARNFNKLRMIKTNRNDKDLTRRTIQAGQREMSHIRNQFKIGRDVVHVIAESMRNQWIGIRFDLIPDMTGNAVMPKTRDQVSALDLEWSKLNQTNQLN